jgi:hypothetical protein
MTARTARRISQPDSRCVPNRNAVLNKKNVVALPRLPHSRCVPNRNAVLNKKNVVALPRLPLAQLQPRKHCRETSAARIRKAGRILTAPLPQLQPWLFSTKNGVDAQLPLARLHPRNALPRVSLAARIRKAGRILPHRCRSFSRGCSQQKTASTRHHHLRSFIRASTAASLPRGQNPKGRSNPDRTACAASFRAGPRRVVVRVPQSASARSEVNRRYRD